MNESYRRILFAALFAAVLFQTGAHISQSFVNYPTWELIDRSKFSSLPSRYDGRRFSVPAGSQGRGNCPRHARAPFSFRRN